MPECLVVPGVEDGVVAGARHGDHVAHEECWNDNEESNAEDAHDMKKKEYKGTLINKKYPDKKKRWVYRAALKGGPQVV